MDTPVLILAPPDDAHAIALRRVLEFRHGVPCLIWDVSTTPADAKLTFLPEEGATHLEIERSATTFRLERCRSVWWRRPTAVAIPDVVVDQKVRQFCRAEYDTLLKGIFHSLQIPIINDPASEARAVHKPFQLSQARKVGLDIPKTIMTNDPELIREFWVTLSGRCIYKAYNAPAWTFTETRMLTIDDLNDLPKVRHAPIIVQEAIEKGKDVRVTIFGDEVFAAEVKTNVREADLDWRIDLTAKWEPHALPSSLSEALRLFLSNLGLRSGCLDLRQQPDGSYKFFEVNPSGQFLFVEIDTGQPLLESLARLLLN
jgi:glutathione synthase/RimK-type ligase-like ATP-grasp enzyme